MLIFPSSDAFHPFMMFFYAVLELFPVDIVVSGI